MIRVLSELSLISYRANYTAILPIITPAFFLTARRSLRFVPV